MNSFSYCFAFIVIYCSILYTTENNNLEFSAETPLVFYNNTKTHMAHLLKKIYNSNQTMYFRHKKKLKYIQPEEFLISFRNFQLIFFSLLYIIYEYRTFIISIPKVYFHYLKLILLLNRTVLCSDIVLLMI